MDFKKENDLEREFYNQDFSAMKELLERIRGSLASKFPVKVNDLNLKGIFDYDDNISFTYITVQSVVPISLLLITKLSVVFVLKLTLPASKFPLKSALILVS